MSNIATEIRRSLEGSHTRKIVSIDEIQAVEELVATLRDPFDDDSELEQILRDADPAYLAYMEMLEHLTIFSQLLLRHPTLKTHATYLAETEEDFMPEGPPISPITPSFYYCWKFFDAQLGEGESMAQLFINLGSTFKAPANVIELVKRCISSRMGIFKQIGSKDDFIHLREIVTNREITALCPAGYKGKKGKIWLTRILPSLAGSDYGVMVTTPYILMDSTERQWQAFFKRQDINSKDPEVTTKLDAFMRNASSPHYWMEYIVDGFVRANTDGTAIYLTGIPDVDDSLPHRNGFSTPAIFGADLFD